MERLLSPPQQLFFQSYLVVYRGRPGDRLPALIPQVYLHYDPLMARELPRGKSRIRQRMDYLMLLPGRQRVVVEIDGKQHYANGNLAIPGSMPRWSWPTGLYGSKATRSTGSAGQRSTMRAGGSRLPMHLIRAVARI
jgi:hypothetical protein